MFNRNANWSHEAGTTRPTIYRGDWYIVQTDVAEYVLYVTGFKGPRARCNTLTELQILTEEFVETECGGNWRKCSVPVWIPREPSQPWVQTQLP